MDGKNFAGGQQAQQKKPDALTDNVLSRDQEALKRFADSDIGNTSPVNGHESADVNMEVAISAFDAIRAGGLGVKDDIGSLLTTAIDSTDFEASLWDACDFEGKKEQPSCPGLGYKANETDNGSKPSDVPQQSVEDPPVGQLGLAPALPPADRGYQATVSECRTHARRSTTGRGSCLEVRNYRLKTRLRFCWCLAVLCCKSGKAI